MSPRKSWSDTIGSGNPEAHGFGDEIPEPIDPTTLSDEELDRYIALMEETFTNPMQPQLVRFRSEKASRVAS